MIAEQCQIQERVARGGKGDQRATTLGFLKQIETNFLWNGAI